MKLQSPITSYLCFYRIWLVAALVLLIALAAPAKALDIDGAEILSGTAVEGGLIIARTNPANQVMLDDDAIEIGENGVFVIGFHRDSDAPVTLRIIAPDGRVKTRLLSPRQRDYNIQRIDGLKSTMVTPPATVLARIKSDGGAVRAARQRQVPLGDFWRGFDWPALGRISGIYGSQRILNGQPRQPHYGIDIAAPTGTPVYAPASGLVTLVKDLYFSGWTVVIAHGLGVNSSFLHLDRVDVSTGMMVERGGLIGTIGATGRATGPHLDWRIDWQGRRIDPGLLVGAMPDPAS
jgi:murein DD-endopeptidase MepM/ murein hydrolase activator NlpD